MKDTNYRYAVWDTVSYSHMESLMPFCMLYTSDSLSAAYKLYSARANANKDSAFIVTDQHTNDIIIDGRTLIYESPDAGKTIYSRRPGLTTERTLVIT